MQQAAAVRDRGRFTPPHAQVDLVERSRLDGNYHGALGKVVLVVAPAGYGKSTLVARWAGLERRPLRWLDLEPVDDDPIVLMTAIARALAGLAGVPDDAGTVSISRRAFEHVVGGIAEPFTLVLDDVECLRDPAASDVIRRFVRQLRPDSTVVLAGRAVHDEALTAELRLMTGTIELGASDLALQPSEVASLLARRGVDAPAEHFARYEGWPAGLALAMSATTNPYDGVAAPESYLTTMWMSEVPDDDRRLLGELACLGRFRPEMCDDVLGRRGCVSTLRRLRRSQLVLDALDERDGGWYRLHPIVAEWAGRELRSDDPQRWREIHLRAADWWEAAGDPDLAFGFAHRVGALARCESIVVTHGGPATASGRQRTVHRWLLELGGEYVRASPQLCAIAAAAAPNLGDGAGALGWSQALANAVGRHEVSDELKHWSNTLNGSMQPKPSVEVHAMLEDAYVGLPSGAWRAFACWPLGAVRYLLRLPGALDVLDQGVFEARTAGVPRLEAHNAALHAVLRHLEGDRTAAERAHQVYRAMTAVVPDTTATSATLLAMVALDEARSGRRAAAAATIAQARGFLEQLDRVAPWFHGFTLVPLAEAALLIDDVATSRRSLDQAEAKLAHDRPDHGLAPHIEAVRRRVEAAETSAGRRAAALTIAELNVLRYLPTNLSLADIADELFVSRNTVKSQTAAIYRKLGTTSRRETVDLARATGLIGDVPR
ncbi:MAG: hypothetical protein CL424_07840 [Acidimicrobiaceae bacterium]|nr:hypothetical protein [Acidimicrobiaceae bacterium]